ncbi:hypothetical protein FRB94_004147 [Tulasnella sp. JGI-2019a]|nr:hypothetical protein FRB94_004147 [Tulasnella sp. JGI-2019a]
MDTLANISIIPLAIGGIVVYVLGTCAYNFWFHPLRNIPGPWYAAISPAYITFKDLTLQKPYAIHALLEQYGGIVRVAPNMVLFADHAAMKTAYTKFPKSMWYKAIKTNDNDHAMTTLEPIPHSIRKRAYAPHYTPANLILYQNEIHEFTNDCIDKMRIYDGKRPFDCLVLFRRLLTDIIFISSYGQRIQSVKQWDIINHTTDLASNIVTAVNLFPMRGVFLSIVGRPIFNLLNSLPFAIIRPFFDSDKIVAEYVIRARDQVLERDPSFKTTGELDSDGNGDERLSLVHRLLRQSLKAKPEERLSDADVISEAMAHTIAGVETSSTTLTYMMYNLARYPTVLAKLREEIDPLMHGEDGRRQIPDISVLNKLPYLNAFYMESMRLYGAVPSMLERVVPAVLDGEEFTIKGHKITPGTIVATQGFTVHRDPAVFPKPEEFIPERWFNETEEMRAYWMPYGTGNRVCGGMNLAHMSLRILTVALARNFDIVIPAETTEASMKMNFAFVAMPTAMAAPLLFKFRED